MATVFSWGEKYAPEITDEINYKTHKYIPRSVDLFTLYNILQ